MTGQLRTTILFKMTLKNPILALHELLRNIIPTMVGRVGIVIPTLALGNRVGIVIPGKLIITALSTRAGMKMLNSHWSKIYLWEELTNASLSLVRFLKENVITSNIQSMK